MNPLTPIGFDTPQLQYAVTPQVAQALQPDMTPDTTGLNLISEANKSFQQTNQAQLQSYQVQAQAMDSIAKAQVSSAQAIAQADSVNIQASQASGQSSIRAWASLTQNVGELVDKATKAAEAKRLAELKAELDRNQIQSTTELENLRVDWIEGGKIGKEGTSAYRRAVSDVLAKRPLQADTITSLTSTYYSPALTYANKQQDIVYETAKKTTEYQEDILAKQLTLELTTSTAGLSQAQFEGSEGRVKYMANIDAIIAKVNARTDISEVAKARIIAEGLGPVVRASGTNAEGVLELQRRSQGAQEVVNYINTNAPRVMNGEIQQSTFNDEANEIRRRFGLPEKETTPPDVNLQRTYSNMQTRDGIESLEKKGYLSRLEALEGNKLYAQSIGLQLYLSPTDLAIMKEDKTLDKNARAGIALAEEANTFYGPTTTAYQKKIEEAKKTLAEIQQRDYGASISLINKSAEASATSSLATSLRALGLGLPAAPAGQTEATQEQLAFMRANSEAVQRAVADTVNGTSAEGIAYKKQRDSLQERGFFSNKEESQKKLVSMSKVTEEYNNKLEALRMKGVQQLQPGQSPNFNGGSLGTQVPLMKRSFRGVTGVTMPFPVGAAQAMSDAGGAGSGGYFGDARPGRTHAGTDFPVPTGTPALSLVYGTVTEVRKATGAVGYGNMIIVKGDDGVEYLYAHLDKVTSATGQRVGPGERIGFTGESGAPNQPHLHLETLVNGAPVDPLPHLASREFGQQPRQVRTEGQTARLGNVQASVDPRAIPIGGGRYLLNGKTIDFSTSNVLSGPMGVQDVEFNPSVQKPMKIAPGLEVIGFKQTIKVDTNTKDGTPFGYYTFRNKEGGVLTQTAYFEPKSKNMPTPFGFDGKSYVTPKTQTSTKGDYASYDTGQPNLDALRRAIIGQESNGDSRILNPDSGAIGYGQVMPANVPSWTKQALGFSMTPAQFREDPKAQIKTINHMMGQMLKTALKSTGGDLPLAIRRTASEWYSGDQSLYDDPKPQTYGAGSYPSIREYTLSVADKYKKQLGSPSSPSRPATPATPARPVGDIPIGGGKYLRKGKVVSSLYTPESPLQQSYASASRYDYAPATEPDTYGYQQLEREPESLARINAMATDTGLPPQWIADVAALHGTSGIDGPEELDILASKLKGRVIKTPTDLVAAILGDGSKVTELGVHAGRRYDSQFSRFDRVTARVHTALIADCRMCANLQAQAVFIPHKGELA